MLLSLRKFLMAAVMAALVFQLGACAGKPRVEDTTAENVISAVNRGDTVRATSRTGIEHEFVVTRITNKALYGDDKRLTYDKMASVEVVKRGSRRQKVKTGEPGWFSRLWSKMF
ncbi:MAG: hypothetical protein ACPGZP_09160 [Panacagrimonas sp.]